MKQLFKKGDKVIWDSLFGYDIGLFIGEGNQYNTYLIDVKSGMIREKCSYSKYEIHHYSEQMITELAKKYGYEKRF